MGFVLELEFDAAFDDVNKALRAERELLGSSQGSPAQLEADGHHFFLQDMGCQKLGDGPAAVGEDGVGLPAAGFGGWGFEGLLVQVGQADIEGLGDGHVGLQGAGHLAVFDPA